MNFALIGCGQYGRNYVKAIEKTGDRLLYVFNRSSPLSVPLPEEAFFTNNLSDILAHPAVETAIIATPPKSHFDTVRNFLTVGKNVICEKPLVFSSSEAIELTELAKSKGLKLLVNHSRLFSSYMPLVTELFARNKNRKIHFHIENGNWGPMRSYSALWDYGPHEIAFLNAFIDIHKASGLRISKEEIGQASNYYLSVTSGNISFNISFGNGFVSKRRGLTVFVDGAPYPIMEDPNDNPLVELIRFFKEYSSDHAFFSSHIPVTSIIESIERYE